MKKCASYKLTLFIFLHEAHFCRAEHGCKATSSARASAHQKKLCLKDTASCMNLYEKHTVRLKPNDFP